MLNNTKIIAGLILIIIVIYIVFLHLQNKENYQSIITTTTDPVIYYEWPIPTNYKDPAPTRTKNLTLYDFVKKPILKPGFYADNHVDILTTNGIYTVGSKILLHPNTTSKVS
jgi:hypothetical protein